MAERHQLLDGGTRGARRKHRGVQLRVEAQLPRGARQKRATFFIHLNGSHKLIQQRLSERKGHFMPPALLPSQFAILEPLVPEENGVEISIEGSVDEMVDRAIEALTPTPQLWPPKPQPRPPNPPSPSPHVSDSPETDRQNPKPVHVCPIPQKRTNRTQKQQPNCPIHQKRTCTHQNGLPYVRISRIGQI